VVVAVLLGSAGAAAADPQDFTLMAGVPSRLLNGADQPGWISAWIRTGGRLTVTEQMFSLGDGQGDDTARFGRAMLIHDLNHDGFDDLIAGAPGSPGKGPEDVPGHVNIIFGSADGLTSTGAITLTTQADPGDEFGTSLSLSTRTTWEGSRSPNLDLWVGAPGHDVGGKADAGAIFRYTIRDDGPGNRTASFMQMITEGGVVPGSAEAGDRFGEVLTGYADNGTVVGVPREDVGSRKDAGAMVRLRIDDEAGWVANSPSWTQNSPGVPGVAEAGDRFGASVAAHGRVVGVPGEDIGTIKDAGGVQLFTDSVYPNVFSLVPSVAYSQSSAGIPGINETGDLFGASVTTGVFQCLEHNSIAIGAPGEDVGAIRNAGTVTMVLLPESGVKLKDCPAKGFSQGNGLPGTAEIGDQLGTAVSKQPGDPELEEDMRDAVVIGVPGENVGKLADAGWIVLGTGSAARNYGFRASAIQNLRLGSFFPSW
jgi:hypothetical protein